MEEVRIFSNNLFGKVRIIINEDGEPLFCASDICNSLKYSNCSDAISNHVDEEDIAKRYTLTKGGYQSMIYVNESGLYSLILCSKVERAKEFKRWVTNEVLPSIRKTGSYSIVNENSKVTINYSLKDKMDTAVFLASFLNLNNVSKLMIAKAIAEPLGLPLPDYTPSKGILKSASELLQERGVGVSAQKFNQKAVECGLLCELERNSSKGTKKKFKSITEKGIAFGENQVSPKNPKETQPLWYDNKFDELLGILGFTND